MSIELVQAMRSIRDDLHPVENSVDVTLGHLGRLLATTCDARVKAGVPAIVGSKAINELLTGTALLGEVRERVLLAHESFVAVAREQLPELGFGDLGKCPAQGSADATRTPQTLQMVR